MRGAEHDRLWNQLEAEIHLHRHKTVIRACRYANCSFKSLNIDMFLIENELLQRKKK